MGNKTQRFEKAVQAIEDAVLRTDQYIIKIRLLESFSNEGVGCIDLGVYKGTDESLANCEFSAIEVESFEDAIIEIGEWFMERNNDNR